MLLYVCTENIKGDVAESNYFFLLQCAVAASNYFCLLPALTVNLPLSLRRLFSSGMSPASSSKFGLSCLSHRSSVLARPRRWTLT
mmetsp:Transcript_31460/g.75157  ORF Transcript_31460/g.75157 Transcript_31460/m.75157 type:complete len:85 (+) Transcript_31460:21-275(+)